MSLDPSRVQHYAVVFVVFGVTGGIALLLSRLVLNGLLGLDGSFIAWPWAYRIAYLALILPSYSVILIAVGTLLGKRDFFQRRVMRLWGWLLPRSLRR